MAQFAINILEQVDAQLERALADWNLYSTLICVALISCVLVPLFFTTEPDLHPFLVARQSSPSRVRQPGESATFRSLETPHGYPLRTGLNVKDPGAPKWSGGRDGDLRDVWRKAVTGPMDNTGSPSGKPGKTLTAFGNQGVIEQSFEKLSADLNAIGKHLRVHGSSRVAIYLSNSTELLVALFACAFYGLTPILVPQEQSLDDLASILKETKADTLVVGAGAVPLNELTMRYSSLKEVIWVVPPSSRHMDWHEVAEGEGGKADVAVWHEIIEETKQITKELPTEIPVGMVPNIVMLSEKGNSGSKDYEVVEYTQGNMVAAISAQVSVLPHAHRLGPSDMILPLAALTDMYALTVVLAALHSNASLALTSVCGPKATLFTTFQGVSPTLMTVIVAHPETLARFEKEQRTANLSGSMSKYWHSRKLQSLAAGSMPSFSGPWWKLRLIYTFHNANGSDSPLSLQELSDLRIFSGARVINAYAHNQVAGAICQTHALDYSHHGLKPKISTHFGTPLSCVEFKLKEAPGYYKMDDHTPTGRLVVSGPAVVGGNAIVDQLMMVTQSNTLSCPH